MRAGSPQSSISVWATPAWFTPSSLSLYLALGALAVYGIGFASPYDLRFLTIVCVYAVMVLGFQFIFGHIGAVSLAQQTFFGIGAYLTGLTSVAFGWDTAILLPLSIMAAVALAALIAVPVLKLEDHYFSLATLGIALGIQLTVVNWESLTGGLNGLAGISGVHLFGYPLITRLNTFIFCWCALLVATLLSTQILNSLYGLSFNLVRESQHAAASLGIDVGRLRFVAFLLSAAYGGAAGAMMVQVLRVASPELLDLSLMAMCLIMAVVGGSRSPLGAIVGALLIVFLREQFRITENYSLIAYSTTTLIVLILAPLGIVGSLERFLKQRYRRQVVSGVAPDSTDGRFEVSASTRGALGTPTARDPANADACILRVEGAAKQFGGVRALDNVDLTVNEGEIVGLIGPNGSGKTTLINVISGLYVPDGGRIIFDGEPITSLPPHVIAGRGIARTFQHIDLVGDLDTIDNIAIGAFRSEKAALASAIGAFGSDPTLARARDRAAQLAALLGVSAPRSVPCDALPYGIRRRVEIARALAANPRLLLLDEPAAGLNEHEQADLAARIKMIVEAGIAVLVIEHNLLFLGALATRMVCLDRGQVIAAGSPEAVRADPRVIEAYLGEPA